jgi:hypothetical protein
MNVGNKVIVKDLHTLKKENSKYIEPRFRNLSYKQALSRTEKAVLICYPPEFLVSMVSLCGKEGKVIAKITENSLQVTFNGLGSWLFHPSWLLEGIDSNGNYLLF